MLDECNNKLKDYADVKERYYRYTDEFKTDEEAILFSRPAILDIITNSTGTQGTVQSFTVTDNDVNFVVYTSNLDEVAVIRQRLESMEDVHDVAVYSATKSENNVTWVNSSIKFSVGEEPQPEPEAPAAGESEVDENAE